MMEKVGKYQNIFELFFTSKISTTFVGKRHH